MHRSRAETACTRYGSTHNYKQAHSLIEAARLVLWQWCLFVHRGEVTRAVEVVVAES